MIKNYFLSVLLILFISCKEQNFTKSPNVILIITENLSPMQKLLYHNLEQFDVVLSLGMPHISAERRPNVLRMDKHGVRQENVSLINLFS